MPALLAAAHGDNSAWILAVSAAHGTDDSRRDTFASHDTANTLPAYNVRRFTHEHPPCLELTRLLSRAVLPLVAGRRRASL